MAAAEDVSQLAIVESAIHRITSGELDQPIDLGDQLSSRRIGTLLERLRMDLRDAREKQKELAQMAFYDELTQLPNLVLLQDRFNQAQALGQRRDPSFGRNAGCQPQDLRRRLWHRLLLVQLHP